VILAALAAISFDQAAYAGCSISQMPAQYLGQEAYNLEHSIGDSLWTPSSTGVFSSSLYSTSSLTPFGQAWIPYFVPSFGFNGPALDSYPNVQTADTPIGRILIGLYVLQNAYLPQAANDRDLSGPIVKWAWAESYQQYYDENNILMKCTSLTTFASWYWVAIGDNDTWIGATNFNEDLGAWFNESPIERASTLFHESIHRSGRLHDCGQKDSTWAYSGAYAYQTSWLMDYFTESNNFTNSTWRLWAAEQANVRIQPLSSGGSFCTTPPASVRNWVGAGPLAGNPPGGFDQPIDNPGICPLGYIAAGANGNCVLCTDASHGIAANGACLPCPAGSFSNSGVCTPCPAGSFSANPGATSCTSCPAGSYCGANVASPAPCTAGSYSANPGAASCTSCPAGFSSLTGAAQCLKCGSMPNNLATSDQLVCSGTNPAGGTCVAAAIFFPSVGPAPCPINTVAQWTSTSSQWTCSTPTIPSCNVLCTAAGHYSCVGVPPCTLKDAAAGKCTMPDPNCGHAGQQPCPSLQ
jgi:hypothetical protein